MLLAICEKKLAIFASTGNYFRPWKEREGKRREWAEKDDLRITLFLTPSPELVCRLQFGRCKTRLKVER